MDFYWYFIEFSTETQQDFQCHTMPLLQSMQSMQCQLRIQCHLCNPLLLLKQTMPFMQYMQCQLWIQCRFCNSDNSNCACNAIYAIHTMPIVNAMPFVQPSWYLSRQCLLCNLCNAHCACNAISAIQTMPIVHAMPFMQYTQCPLCMQCHLFCETMPNMHTMPFVQAIQCQICKQCHLCNIYNANNAHNAICVHNAILTE